MGLGVEEVRDVIEGSGPGVEGLERVTGMWFTEVKEMVSVGLVCVGKVTGGGRGLTTGRRCGRGG